MSAQDDLKKAVLGDFGYVGAAELWDLARRWRNLTKEERMDLLAKLLKYVFTLSLLDGYRTQLAGASGIISGVSLLALAASGDPHGSVEGGIAAITGGLAIIGHAGKQDKLIAATKENTEAVKAIAK